MGGKSSLSEAQLSLIKRASARHRVVHRAGPKQAAIVLDNTEAAFAATPILKHLITNRTADTLELGNQISVEVRSSNFRRLRRPIYLAVICQSARNRAAHNTRTKFCCCVGFRLPA
jgi:hypothetical protein